MIVLDENVHDQRILAAIAAWYPGQVVSVTVLRPQSIIKDEAIPELLRQALSPRSSPSTHPIFGRELSHIAGLASSTLT
jgi:hypothetical protein